MACKTISIYSCYHVCLPRRPTDDHCCPPSLSAAKLRHNAASRLQMFHESERHQPSSLGSRKTVDTSCVANYWLLMEVTARDLKFLAIGAVASVGLTALLTSQYRNNIHAPCRIIDSPLPLVQRDLTEGQQKRLPYAPDALEGARDVDTPFGNIRVYEWGPEDGKKVLLIHGISTPCIALSGLAEELVKKDCRVMMFGE